MSDNISLEAFEKLVNRLDKQIDKKFNKVDDQLEKITTQIEGISVVSVKNSIILDEHIRRTELLEEKLEVHREEFLSTLARHEQNSLTRDTEIEKTQEALAESVELVVKLPQYLYKIGKWAAAVSALGTVIWTIVNFLIRLFG